MIPPASNPNKMTLNKTKSLLLFISVIIIVASLSYLNSLYGSFIFDDELSVVGNPAVKNISYFKEMGLKDFLTQGISGGRPLTTFTFALNYFFSGLEPFGYHLGNLLIHLANCLLVFIFIFNTLKLSETYKEKAGLIAFFTALLFSVHPIQTGAVSYISQRAEILASFFYLSSLLLFITALRRGASMQGILCYVAGVILFFLGLGSKEIIVTLPVAVFLYWTFFLKKLPELNGKIQKSMLAILLLPAVAGVIYRIYKITLHTDSSMGFSIGITPFEYLLTQCRVITRYIFLLFAPFGQNADYDFTLSKGLFDPPSTIFGLLFIVLLLAAAAFLYKRWRTASFGILWFFIVLSPTSSFIPLRDLIMEHRMYLASVGIFLIFALCLYHLSLRLKMTYKGKAYITATVILLMIWGLGYLTVKRNYVWLNSQLFWEDVVQKSPNKARGYISLANAYKADGNLRFAIAAYSKGVSLSNNIDKPYFTLALALAYAEDGRHEMAMPFVKDAFEIAPEGSPEMFYIAGNIHERAGNDSQAIEYYQKALQKSPDMLLVRYQLGNLFHKKGLLKEAIAEFEAAIKSNPDYATAYNDVGIVYAKSGNMDKARLSFEQALKLKPDYIAARKNLENVIRLEEK